MFEKMTKTDLFYLTTFAAALIFLYISMITSG